MIHSPKLAVDVLEAAHSSYACTSDWLEGMAQNLERFLRSPTGVSVVVVERRESCYHVWRDERGEAALRFPRAVADAFKPFSQILPSVNVSTLDAYYRFGLVGTRSEVAARLAPDTEDPSTALLSSIGMSEALGMNAPVGDLVLNVSAAIPRPVRLDRVERRLLAQITLHLASALAMRQGLAREVAVIDPEGRLLHAAGPAREPRLASSLRRRVEAVERSRTRRQRSQAGAVDAWRALVEGRWGLVERLEPGGARHYLALETPEHHQPLRALTPLETRVLELSARGVSGKLVGYGLGVSAARVSQALQNAALKLGVHSRTELVRLGAIVLGQRDDRLSTLELTKAEEDVLLLLRRGLSNAEIAKQRQSSPRTVANQVASLLAKARVPSRRALASRL